MENDADDMFAGDEHEETETSASTSSVIEIVSSNSAEVTGDSDDVVVIDNTETLNEHPSSSTNNINNDTGVRSVNVAGDPNTTIDDFVEGTISVSTTSAKVSGEKDKVKKNSKGKKRKAAESIESTDTEEGSVCTICFEDWSNSGDHRISSLKCGHFFGYSCIDKWLRGSGNACPNCNEKNTKKDIRVHFVSKLAAIDTSERDRALQELESVKTDFRELQLRHTELNVRLKLQQEKIDQLETDNRRYRERGGELPVPSLVCSIKTSVISSGKLLKLVHVRKHEVCRPSTERDKCCRVMAVSEYQGMIVISQPSANPLFPGFGARRFNMLDQKLGNFVGLGKEVIRDFSFHPVTPELLLSCGQEKVVRVTNMVSCSEVVRFTVDTEVWACDWAMGGQHSHLYLGTKRSQILVHDTLQPTAEPLVISFPGSERRPIISLVSVPSSPASGLSHPGLLVLTLGSLWYFEHNLATNTLTPHKLPTPAGRMFWSLEYEASTRLILLVCRPGPLATHLVMELVTTEIPHTGKVVTVNTIMTVEGGSYKDRSFLRSCLMVTDKKEGRVMMAYTRGTGLGDIKVVVQEVPTGRIVQELGVGKPVLDVKVAAINNQQYLAVLGETDLNMYRVEQS